jgi:YD repeat-containing protein
MESIAKITYNDHSDKSEEHTILIGGPNPSRDAQPSEASPGAHPSSQQTEARYSYKYDTFGNWTEQTISSPTSQRCNRNSPHHRVLPTPLVESTLIASELRVAYPLRGFRKG